MTKRKIFGLLFSEPAYSGLQDQPIDFKLDVIKEQEDEQLLLFPFLLSALEGRIDKNKVLPEDLFYMDSGPVGIHTP
jgi:hypothetical protein